MSNFLLIFFLLPFCRNWLKEVSEIYRLLLNLFLGFAKLSTVAARLIPLLLRLRVRSDLDLTTFFQLSLLASRTRQHVALLIRRSCRYATQ